jgi:hydrogenase-4 component F
VNLLVATLTAPLVTAGIGALPGPRRPKEAVLVGGLATTFGLAVATARRFLAGETPGAFGGALRVDGLSALVVVLTAFVGLLSGLYSVGYLERNERAGFVSARRRRELLALVPAYLGAMLLVAASNNLGILWIAVEATTLASVFLVAFHNRDTSLEAAWKFLVLGSVGLAFALLGTVLLFASGQGVLGEETSALDWTRLLAHATQLHPFTVKLAVVFLLIGYGTKAGLAPMHTWKPDAYREAPSPAGVLMAVGMMNCSVYALLRVHLISKAVLGPAFSGRLLLAFGLASVLVATPFILIQWNLKRLLAYSSIEHVGIMAVGFGLGGETAAFGALLHMTYHAFAKPVAFFSAGTLAQLHRSSDFDEIGAGTLARSPVASGLLLLATLMVTGSPPFGLFFSEMTILKAGFFGPHPAVTSVFLAALVVLFCGFFYQVGRLVLGEAPRLVVGEVPELVAGPDATPANRGALAERLDLALGTTLVAAVVAVLSAFYLPGPLVALIRAALQVVEAGA